MTRFGQLQIVLFIKLDLLSFFIETTTRHTLIEIIY